MPGGGNEQMVISATPFDTGLRWSPDGARLIYSQLIPTSSTVKRITSILAADGTGQVAYGSGLSPSWGDAPAVITPTDVDVIVLSGRTSVKFGSVTGGLTKTTAATTFTPISPAAVGSAPEGYDLGQFAYEISTTASYTPPLNVCMQIDAGMYETPEQFARLRILHKNGDELVDRTILPVDFSQRSVCASVDSLGAFALAESIDSLMPSIYGIVLDANGAPMSDLTVRLTGEENRTQKTDLNGLFSFVNLTTGANYTVTPNPFGYVYDFSSQSYIDIDSENSIVFRASGKKIFNKRHVRDEFDQPIVGTIVSLSGDSEAQTLTDINGFYSFAELDASGSYAVSPESGDYQYSPPQAVIGSLEHDVNSIDFIASADRQRHFQ